MPGYRVAPPDMQGRLAAAATRDPRPRPAEMPGRDSNPHVLSDRAF